MRTISVKSYPEEGMALVFFKGKNIITQCVYVSEEFGIYTLFQGKWRKLSNKDESLNDSVLIDILPVHYKVVSEMFTRSEASGTYLKYEDVEKYRVVFDLENPVST